MGITGLLKHLGPGERVSIAVLAAQFYSQHDRPLRLAIDISIWLFQIQAGQGGSNPALRTFYYRLLRLIALNIHPLFVFDGPNKPTFKRNKKVGGSGVRVATVPEFLAKQLLKQFGMPLHVAPGEAEAECALLQQKGVVDAVLSDDVDTMMFGSTLTLRNWSTEGSSKTPTHVNVYRAEDVEKSSGIDRSGMILVALMSGGDYLPAGIVGCGPKIAVDAAKAGFGAELLALPSTDSFACSEWRERLQGELATNASKNFTRRNPSLRIPSTFPNAEVLGYYTSPCISADAKVEELRQRLSWDHELDFAALRSFAGDAFDWHNIGGAKAFIRNLAPSMLSRELRKATERKETQMTKVQGMPDYVCGIYGQRQHFSVDNAVEIRISYKPAALVPIDLSIEPEDEESDGEGLPASSQRSGADTLTLEDEIPGESDVEVPATPSKRKRKTRPFDPTEPAKLWLLREWVQLSCPAELEDYESKQRAVQLQKQRLQDQRAARSAPGKSSQPSHARKLLSSAKTRLPANAMMRHVVGSKSAQASDLYDGVLTKQMETPASPPLISKALFALPSTQVLDTLLDDYEPAIATRAAVQSQSNVHEAVLRTPTRRNRSAAASGDKSSPNRSIAEYFSPSRRSLRAEPNTVIDLTSSPSSTSLLRAASQDQQTKGAQKEKPSAPRVASVPLAQPRVKFRKSLSMPIVFTDDTVNEDMPLTPHGLLGSSLQPIELSPNIPSTKQTSAIPPDQHRTRTDSDHHAHTQHPTTKAGLLSKQNVATASSTSKTPAKLAALRHTIYGHRISQVEFLDLTGL